MLPDFLYSTYSQYKADTSKIVAWLAETADKYGYAQAVAGDSTKAPKLKGRARKLARDAATAAKKAPGSAVLMAAESSDNRRVVRISEIVPFAQHIAKHHDAEFKIPMGFLKLVKRCIKARTGATEWFQTLPGEEEKISTNRHLHFIDVLKEMLKTLIPIDELKAANKLRKKGKTSSDEKAGDKVNELLENMFSILSVDEVDEAAFEALPSAASSAPSSGPVRYELENLDDDGEEWFFALHCLFDDIHVIQHYLKGLWHIYQMGDIDLGTVAVVTNTAIDLVRRAEEDFTREMRVPKGYNQYKDAEICELYYIDSCFRFNQPPRRVPGELVDFERWDFVVESFQLPFRILTSWKCEIERTGSSCMITRPNHLGTYDPSLDRSDMEPEELAQQDSALLSDMLATLWPYTAVANTPNDDELMKGLLGTQPDKRGKAKLKLWTVFAAQNFLDTRAVLGTAHTLPFNDLQDFAKSARRTLRGHFKFFEKHNLIGYRDEIGEAVVKKMHDEIEQ